MSRKEILLRKESCIRLGIRIECESGPFIKHREPIIEKIICKKQVKTKTKEENEPKKKNGIEHWMVQEFRKIMRD